MLSIAEAARGAAGAPVSTRGGRLSAQLERKRASRSPDRGGRGGGETPEAQERNPMHQGSASRFSPRERKAPGATSADRAPLSSGAAAAAPIRRTSSGNRLDRLIGKTPPTGRDSNSVGAQEASAGGRSNSTGRVGTALGTGGSAKQDQKKFEF